MPRELHPDLRDVLERANPYTEYRIEISEPDVSQVLRRQDQFLTPIANGGPLVSMSPANSLSASARGSLILTPTDVPLASFTGVGGSFDLNGEDPGRRIKGMSWTMDKAFNQGTLMSFKAKVQRVAIAGFFFEQSFELQIFRIMQIPGVRVKNVGSPNYSETAVKRYEFFPQLSSAPVLKSSNQSWDGSQIATLNFSGLVNYRLQLQNTPTRAVTPDQTGDLPKYLFVVRLVGKPLSGTGHFKWLTDTVASHTVANVGTFERVFWARDNDGQEWTEQVFADVPNSIF